MDDSSEAARALTEVDWIRDRVIHVVGHALRTPVTTLCGMAESLARTDDPATRAELAEGVIRNARTVERLLDQLLTAADVSTVFPVEDPVVIDVDQAVTAAWDGLDADATLDLAAAGATVTARTVAVDQILRCVLENAWRYGDGTVGVWATTAGPVTAIEVESTGARPTDDELDRAFELFTRGEHAVTTTVGLGTGLPVARRLARLEGGDVTMLRRGDAIVTRIELPA